MTRIEKVFFKLSIAIPVTITLIHLLYSTIFCFLNIDGLISFGYLSVIALTLTIDIPLSVIIIIILNFIKETILYKQTSVFLKPYLFIIISAIASLLTIFCYLLLQIFINAIINDIIFASMICFLLISTIFLTIYIINKKKPLN